MIAFAYFAFVICAAISGIAAGSVARARPGDNEIYYGVPISVFFGLASIAMPIVIALHCALYSERKNNRGSRMKFNEPD
jgi:hypothetical protein